MCKWTVHSGKMIQHTLTVLWMITHLASENNPVSLCWNGSDLQRWFINGSLFHLTESLWDVTLLLYKVSVVFVSVGVIEDRVDDLHVFLLVCGIRRVKDPLYLLDAFSSTLWSHTLDATQTVSLSYIQKRRCYGYIVSMVGNSYITQDFKSYTSLIKHNWLYVHVYV